MTVVNTFVFIAQVLLLLPPHWAGDAVKSCPAAIHRAERIITADNKETATHTDRNFLRWTFNENLEFSRFTSPSTSATSAPALPSIKDHPRSALHCGHGGIAKMTVVNTFVFIAQVLLLLPPHWAGDAVKSCPAAIHRAERIITADNKETATHTDRNFLRWTFNENLEFSRFTSPSTSATSAPALPSIKDHPRSALHCGHGGIAKMTVVNTFVFIAQVGKRYPFCYRSNNLCLFLLPCPRTCFALMCEMRARFADLLMLCGDIETNPGPDRAAMMEMLTNISADIKEIKLSQAATTSRLEKIESRLEGLEELRSVVNKNCDKTNRLEATITSLSNKIDDLENRSRRNNLIIFGLSELPNEESSTLEDRVTKEILGGTLNVKINGIDRIHRLGRPAHGKTRPVIFRLVNFKDKLNILCNCNKLKNERLSISEDYSKRIQGIRKKLLDSSKSNKLAGDKVTLTYDKIKINGTVYIWNEAINDKVPISEETRNPST
ncbi:uncharacterized protein ISCGN_012315 [Ixodes scapularis]